VSEAGEDVEDTIVINGLEVTQDNVGDYLSQYLDWVATLVDETKPSRRGSPGSDRRG
jgi:hypothetical protein